MIPRCRGGTCRQGHRLPHAVLVIQSVPLENGRARIPLEPSCQRQELTRAHDVDGYLVAASDGHGLVQAIGLEVVAYASLRLVRLELPAEWTSSFSDVRSGASTGDDLGKCKSVRAGIHAVNTFAETTTGITTLAAIAITSSMIRICS
jgi:hypothetical protein